MERGNEDALPSRGKKADGAVFSASGERKKRALSFPSQTPGSSDARELRRSASRRATMEGRWDNGEKVGGRWVYREGNSVWKPNLGGQNAAGFRPNGGEMTPGSEKRKGKGACPCHWEKEEERR